MKAKIIQLLYKYIPILAKKLWPSFKASLIGDKTPNIVAFRNEPNSNTVILFVHGFSGEAETTFGKIPQYLMEDKNMNGWNMFSVGYSSNQMPSLGIGIWAAIPDINTVSAFLFTIIKHQFGAYKRIAIIAHSMGGLALQKAILTMDISSLERIKYILLFGTPSNGLIKAGLLKFWNRQLRDMSSNGIFITQLRKDWQKKFTGGYPFDFKVVAGTDDEFVPIASSQKPFDKKYCEVVSGNHLAIVKPENINHAGYQLILATLTSLEFNNIGTDKESINLLLGDYTAVVNDLLPQKESLDKRGLSKLVFALEGLGRNVEAIQLLENAPIANNNSDLLGILAGRYKRRYLNNYEALDAQKSIDYYKKGLEIATPKNDQEQIFYHSINIAFLSLVYKEDKNEMRSYAERALNAADKCPDEIWKIATIAEANLYLGKLDIAKQYYAEAGKIAGPRERVSIYANAYMAYTCLKNIESGDDEFIKWLKQTLLNNF